MKIAVNARPDSWMYRLVDLVEEWPYVCSSYGRSIEVLDT